MRLGQETDRTFLMSERCSMFVAELSLIQRLTVVVLPSYFSRIHYNNLRFPAPLVIRLNPPSFPYIYTLPRTL